MQRRHPIRSPGSPVSAFRPSGANAGAGYSIVELLVATLLIMIIFVAWLRISNFQAIRKESFRRLALEKAAGYLDFMAHSASTQGFYRIEFTNSAYVAVTANNLLQPMEPVDPNNPVGYRLRVTNCPAHDGWPQANWAVIELYNKHGVATDSAGKAFSTLSVFKP